MGVVCMSRRKTVQLNIPYVNGKIKSVFRHNIIFCEKMGRAHNWVTDWNRKQKPKNLPSPEEAAKICVLLEVEPEEILTEQADVELVQSLLDAQKEPPPTPEGGGLDAEFIRLFKMLSPEQQARELSYLRELTGGKDR